MIAIYIIIGITSIAIGIIIRTIYQARHVKPSSTNRIDINNERRNNK